MSLPTASEITRIERHLHRFSDPLEAPEQAMLDRLKAGDWTKFDQRFFEHERLEANMMEAGTSWEEAHRRVLEMQGIAYQPGYEANLYHPAVIADPVIGEWFSRAARELSARLAGGEGV
jgi:hypothetical protein